MHRRAVCPRVACADACRLDRMARRHRPHGHNHRPVHSPCRPTGNVRAEHRHIAAHLDMPNGDAAILQRLLERERTPHQEADQVIAPMPDHVGRLIDQLPVLPDAVTGQIGPQVGTRGNVPRFRVARFSNVQQRTRLRVALTEQQEIFTGRTDIGTRIEQLLLDRRRPPLLLYGQRRMGKTSLLNNLGRLLPSNIIPMFVDLQGPVSSASDSAGFLYNIARSMVNSADRQSALTLPSLDRETLQYDPFTRFDEWLDKVEAALQENIALLALDEFEALDDAIRKGRFDEQDVLGMLRHLIQHRPRFKIMLAGSHTIEEFQRWASYLINVQVVHISYLKQPEARQLIEQPVPDFTLRYEPDAVDRVLQLTRCHPFLVQLLCAEIVALKNEQIPSMRRLATLADVEAAIPEALSVGSFFFADIQSNQVDAPGLAILQFLAAQGEGGIVSRTTILQEFPDNFDAIALLLQRELIEEVGDGYCFQVELMRRHFARGVR